MNKIFTLFVMGIACLFTNNAKAQYTRNFDASTTLNDLTNQCWSLNGINWTNDSKSVISGTGSLEIATVSNSITSFTTAYLLPTSNQFNISFKYKLSNSLSTMASRKLEVYVIDNNNVRTLVKAITMNNSSPTSVQLFNETITLPDLLSRRVFVGISGESNDNNNNLIIDDLSVSSKSSSTCSAIEASLLPVKIINFAGSIHAGKAQLNWSVAENETGSFFEVQKSTDGKNFNGSGVIFNTEKRGTETYHYTDANELTAAAYYRLKVLNKDNSASYSKIVLIKNLQSSADNKITLLQNPVQNTVAFSYTSEVKETAEISIFNMAGVKMYSRAVGAQKGNNMISFGLENRITNGNYIITLQSSTNSKAMKFIKQ